MANNSVQLLKAFGHLPSVSLKNLDGAKAAGLAGAIDSDILASRVCGHPDAPDEEIAAANPEDLEKHLGMDLDNVVSLKFAHAKLLEATGRGSWPAGCHMDVYPHDDRHAVSYLIRRSSFNNNYLRPATEEEIRHVAQAGVWPWSVEYLLDNYLGKPLLDVAMPIVHESYRRVGVFLFQTHDEKKADIILICRFIAGSTIGIGWFNNGKCSPNQVESHYDSSWQPSLYRLTLLLLHEIGHNMNLQHTFSGQNRHRGVMSYNWPSNVYGFLDGTEGILPRDPSWDALIKFFGGEPIPLDEEPEQPPPLPPTPKPPTEPVARFEMEGEWYSIYRDRGGDAPKPPQF